MNKNLFPVKIQYIFDCASTAGWLEAPGITYVYFKTESVNKEIIFNFVY